MIGTVARYILSPLLFCQAYRVRAAALRLPDATGPREGAHGRGPTIRHLIVGDSSAAGVGPRIRTKHLRGKC